MDEQKLVEKNFSPEKIVDLATAYTLADGMLNKKYLANLNQFDIVPFKESNAELAKEKVGDDVRMFQVDRIIYDKEENNQEKLLNVYSALHNCGGSVILMIQSDETQMNFYIGTRNTGAAADILNHALQGNFPGTNVELMRDGNVSNVMREIFDTKSTSKNISAVTSTANFREGHTMKSGDFVQGLEKLLETSRGKKFTMIVIANPISAEDLEITRGGYEQLYTQLVPLAKTEINYGSNESQAISDSTTDGITKTITQSVALSNSHSVSNGTSKSYSHSEGTTITDGTTKGVNVEISGSVSSAVAKALGGSLSLGVGKVLGGVIGGAIGSIIPGAGTAAGAFIGAEVLSGLTGSISKTVAETFTKTVGLNAGINYSKTHSEAKSTNDTTTTGTNHQETDTKGKIDTTGTSEGKSQSKTKGNTSTTGTSVNHTIHMENRSIQSLLNRIDEQLKRLDECADIGLWNSAAYIIADNDYTSQLVASNYKALIRGKNSGIENSAVTVWSDKEKVNLLQPYIEHMMHPVLKLFNDVQISVTPAAMLSTSELTIAAGLPQKSLPGILVDDYASFGREVICRNQNEKSNITIGKIYHMGQSENLPVTLDTDKLTAHTFITGSTGAGKSNAVYKILHELNKKHIAWLVIEPAKGEYKDAFGGLQDVTTYGTNPYKTPNLLQLNPFSFPKDIHVLEHIDRLVEIFNACWPMYAAMPAVLREAIEKSYEACGWNLKLSKNPGSFPTFDTVLKVLPKVIDSSAYSSDTSSDYKGALVTRVRSLTRGIHGLIFNDDISFEKLLNQSAIIDLSRVGSQETKSLLMGVLVLKLQEHRMSEDVASNSALRHVTILEEAHNLLRKTSTEQSQESSNLQGQSVQMISNAIAEMRTYGEGFIIADQSPNMMDPSVIRNTNTKIILRLPDSNDRELVGRAASLKDIQIEELAKLERGVAAVFQNDWAEAVLCKVDKFDRVHSLKEIYPQANFTWQDNEITTIKRFLQSALDIRQIKFNTKDKNEIRKWYATLNLSEEAGYIFENVLEGKTLNDSHKVVVLNYALGNVVDQAAKRDEIIEIARNILKGQFDISVFSEITECMEKLFERVLPESFLIKSVEKNIR